MRGPPPSGNADHTHYEWRFIWRRAGYFKFLWSHRFFQEECAFASGACTLVDFLITLLFLILIQSMYAFDFGSMAFVGLVEGEQVPI